MKIKIISAILFFSVISWSYADEQKYVVPIEGSPACGSNTASLTIIEFLDYQ